VTIITWAVMLRMKSEIMASACLGAHHSGGAVTWPAKHVIQAGVSGVAHGSLPGLAGVPFGFHGVTDALEALHALAGLYKQHQFSAGTAPAESE
jgi:hypothetical protein